MKIAKVFSKLCWATSVLSAGLWVLNANALDTGADAYAKHCAACHGENGQGGVGVPLALPDFITRVDDGYLAATIRYGRPGRVMPPFSKLNDQEILAIVQHMRSWSKQAAPKWDNKRIKGDASKGSTLFADHCAHCHGTNGEGGRGTGVTFSRPREAPIVAPALRNQGFLQSATDALIKDVISNGREGTPMISYKKKGLDDQQINDIVSYIRGFEEEFKGKPKRTGKNTDAVLQYESNSSLAQTVENIKQAAAAANFRIIRTQNLNEGLVDKNKEDGKKVVIYFCNFNLLNKALAIDPRVGLFLPCRVTVTEHQGKVFASTINPNNLSTHFNNEELDRLCTDMYDTYVNILEEATL